MKLMNMRNGDIVETGDDSGYSEVFREVTTMMIDGQEWILHDGGECPVDYSWHVAVLLGGGQVYDSRPAGGWVWGSDMASPADIVGYRVLSACSKELAQMQDSMDSIKVLIDRASEALDEAYDLVTDCYAMFPAKAFRNIDYNPSKLGEGHGGEN